MPFGLNLSVLLMLWFICSWFKADKVVMLSGLKNKWFIVLVSFLALTIISALFSENKKEAITAVEVKLSFLAFPYFFFLFKFNEGTVKRIVSAFVSGCLFALLFLLVRATWLYVSTGDNYFFYNRFSFMLHVGYFSMYMLFSIVVLFLVYPVWFQYDKWIKPVRLAMAVLFGIGIFLCASKIGIIALFIVLLLLPLIVFKEVITIKRIGISLIALTAIVILLYNVLPTPFARLTSAFNTASSQNIDKTSSESTAVRILIWGESMEIIKQNFWFGVGVGDANDVLQNNYREHGLTGALAHNLNTHNQYFQSFIGLGVLGFLLLLVSTLGAMIYGFIKKNTVLILFSVIVLLNFLVESMLQTQAGNLFFLSMLCTLLNYNLTEFKGNDTHPHHH